MKKIFLFVFAVIISHSVILAQGFGYDDKTEIGNGLYKVKSGEYYGVVDKDNNVVVSIEYQDIVFNQGKALLTKDNVLFGLIDSLGVIRNFSGMYKVHPNYRRVYEGYIPVSHVKSWMYTHMWGFIDVNERPLRLKQKIGGTRTPLGNNPTLFDAVAPFVGGCAAVYSKSSGWKHIDTTGVERFKLNDNTMASFRSSLYKGECIVVTDGGIKLYQENGDATAVVKRILSPSRTFVEMKRDSEFTKMIYKEGSLSLDSLMRVVKFETDKDSIVFIERPRKVIVKNVIIQEDTLSLKEDVKVELVYKNVQADERGQAYTEIKLLNKSAERFESLHVTLECAGATRRWSGALGKNSEVRLSFNIPARFSTPSLRRNILVGITYKDSSVKYEYPVNIKRYMPVRSR